MAEGSLVIPGIRIEDDLPVPVDHVRSLAFRERVKQERMRGVPEETPVALTFNGTTYAVMMATPADLTDFAVGFSLAEGVITGPADIESLAVVPHATGIELQMWLAPACASALGERRRSLAGPTGCGLCGVESLASVLPPIPRVDGGIAISPQTVYAALSSLASVQPLFQETRAVHAAGFFVPGKGFVSVREDVGRHNALDKLVGDLAHRNIAGATGVVALTGRISIEMVQKTAALGASVIVAISAPTALAIRAAEAAGITLIAIARSDGFEVFTHPARIREGATNR
jgi:FdhD protein